MTWRALLALAAFAANSLLARLALGGHRIDPASFTAIRLGSGALVLWLLLRARGGGVSADRAGLLGAVLLFLYAAPFSFAYLTLPAGTGALILFAAVQFTMIGAGLREGERPHLREWLGLLIAGGGLLYLNLPGLGAPSPMGVGLMALAGVSWGLYSLRGRTAGPPLARTAQSFVLSVPLGALLAGLVRAPQPATGPGIAYAVASGALASGGGYALWYSVLPRLTATRAGTLQLLVPILAAAGGVAFLGERVTLRLACSAAAILGGVALALGTPRRA